MERYRSRDSFRRYMEKNMAPDQSNIPPDGIQQLKSLTPALAGWLQSLGAVTLTLALFAIKCLEGRQEGRLPEGIDLEALRKAREEIETLLEAARSADPREEEPIRWTDIRPLGVPSPPADKGETDTDTQDEARP